MNPAQIARGTKKSGRGGEARAAGPLGMTLLELAIASAVFSMVLLVAYGAVQSLNTLATTNLTQEELQEEARHGLEDIRDTLQNAARISGTTNYPIIFKDTAPYPAGANTNNKPPVKNPPNSKLAGSTNWSFLGAGGDPTLDSDEIIFKVPQMQDPGSGQPVSFMGPTPTSGQPVMNQDATTKVYSIAWSTQEYGFFIVPWNLPDGTKTNYIEFRDSSAMQQQIAAGTPAANAHGSIVARYVDRMEIEDWTTDQTTLGQNQRLLRVTLYLTRILNPANKKEQINVSLSTIVDMRNTTQLY